MAHLSILKSDSLANEKLNSMEQYRFTNCKLNGRLSLNYKWAMRSKWENKSKGQQKRFQHITSIFFLLRKSELATSVRDYLAPEEW